MRGHIFFFSETNLIFGEIGERLYQMVTMCEGFYK